MKRWSMIVVALVVALALGLPATLTAVAQTPTPPPNQAMVRAVNAAANVGPINVTTGAANPVFCNLAYKGVTRYVTEAAGPFSFNIVPITVPVATGTPSAATPTATTPSAVTPTAATPSGVTPTAVTPTQALTATATMTATAALTPTATMTATARATSTTTAAQGTPTTALTGTAATQAAPSGGGGPPVGAVSGSATLVAGQAYSLVAVGTPGNVQVLTLTDDLSAPPAGMAKVRFVHASPNAPAVDVGVAGGATLFSNIAYKSASSYTTVAAGTVNLQVTPTGTSNVVLTLPVNLNSGTVYTIYAVGLVNGQPSLQGLVSVESVTGTPVPSSPLS